MEMTGISKKEYLKKYLSGGDKKKKKKKSTQSLIIKSKIVDDDLDLKNMKPVNEDDLEIFDLAEEAPQIVGIIDERPEEVRLMSEFRSTKKWKIVTDENGIEDIKITAINRRKSDEGSPKMEKEISIEITKNSKKNNSDTDESPPRKAKFESDEPPSKRSGKKEEKRKESDDVFDSSPPRRPIKKEKEDTPPKRSKPEKDDSDASPPRRSDKNSVSSVGRKKHGKDDSDSSPPRKTQERRDFKASRSKRKYDSDGSPRGDSDSSPPRRLKRRDDSDSSPPRKTRHHNSHSDSLPLTNKNANCGYKNSARGETKEKARGSTSTRNGEYGLSLAADHQSSKKEKKTSQLEKTLSGRKAGLQSAEDMRKESETFKKKEKEMFDKMSDEVTGKNAEAVVRNRKTGQRHDSKEEARKKREKEEREAEKIAKYAVWGKGVKQIQDRQDKIKDDLYEMSKPLARYKDDKDLEEMLKNQEREGDPMLEYIRRKKKPEAKSSKPQYEGSYMPNRYGIRPGHKWDGVDRSNGYEKRWFEEQNAKKAREEEAFKWSTIDM